MTTTNQTVASPALVAEAFVGSRPPGLEVNHKNGDKTNNRPANLEYLTRLDNMRHAVRAGLLSRYRSCSVCNGPGHDKRNCHNALRVSLPALAVRS